MLYVWLPETVAETTDSGQGAPISTHFLRSAMILQLPIGRHFELSAITDCLDEVTVVGIAFVDDRTSLATLEQTIGRGELQSGHLHFGSVAGEAAIRQYWPDLRFKKFRTIVRLACRRFAS
jgi:hypothetical protein